MKHTQSLNECKSAACWQDRISTLHHHLVLEVFLSFIVSLVGHLSKELCLSASLIDVPCQYLRLSGGQEDGWRTRMVPCGMRCGDP